MSHRTSSSNEPPWCFHFGPIHGDLFVSYLSLSLQVEKMSFNYIPAEVGVIAISLENTPVHAGVTSLSFAMKNEKKLGFCEFCMKLWERCNRNNYLLILTITRMLISIMSCLTSCEVSLRLKSVFKHFLWTEPPGVTFLQKVSLRSVFKVRKEPPGVNFLLKVSLRNVFKVRTEPPGVNFLQKIICPQTNK